MTTNEQHSTCPNTWDAPDLIAQSEAALEGVTPGPWDAALQAGCHGIVAQPLPEGANFIAFIGNSVETPEREPMRFANARFIAASRTLVPAMIAALRHQQSAARESALEALSAYGQASEAHQAQLAAEARAEAAEAALAWIAEQTRFAPAGSFTAEIHKRATEVRA